MSSNNKPELTAFWIGVLNQRFKTLILPSQNKHERSLSIQTPVCFIFFQTTFLCVQSYIQQSECVSMNYELSNHFLFVVYLSHSATLNHDTDRGIWNRFLSNFQEVTLPNSRKLKCHNCYQRDRLGLILTRDYSALLYFRFGLNVN